METTYDLGSCRIHSLNVFAQNCRPAVPRHLSASARGIRTMQIYFLKNKSILPKKLQFKFYETFENLGSFRGNGTYLDFEADMMYEDQR